MLGKIHRDTGPLYICAVFMPTENSRREGVARYGEILRVLDEDMVEIKIIKNAIALFCRDFNAHIGCADSSPLGISGNNKRVGSNGYLLLMRLENVRGL